MKRVVVTMDKMDDYLVQFSDNYTVEKNIFLTVPKGYTAICYIDGKAMYKTNQVKEDNIVAKVGKDYIGKDLQFAFYSVSLNPEIAYGFGPINVNNDRLKEAYRIGVNGTMTLVITDYVQLIKYFALNESISIEDIREKLLPVIKSTGLPIVSGCFANTNVSVFEIDSMIGDIREEMKKAFVTEKVLDKMGIEVESVTINEIFVNEDDMEMIREHLNNN